VYNSTATGILGHLVDKHKVNKEHINNEDFYVVCLTELYWQQW
jgi:hypothetical protein